LKNEIEQEWAELEPYVGGKKAPGNPSLGVEYLLIKGWSRHPNLHQYDLPNDEPIGCGPAAWGQYLSYHDKYWMPDLLYGTHDSVNDNDYMKKLMKKLHDKMGTGDWLGIDGFTYPSHMDDGTEIFADYLLFDNTYLYSEDWDLDVILFGSSPESSVLDIIISQTDWDEPTIVGLWYYTDDKSKKDKDKSGKVGHYCLGLGYSLNANNELKFVFVDENHGNDYDDWVWWHKQHIFGAWGIKRISYESKRTNTEVNNNLLSIDMASLGDKLYLVGGKKTQQTNNPDYKLLIKRGSAKGYPHPQSITTGGQLPKKLTFDEEIEKSITDIQGVNTPFVGEVSICTWNKKEPKMFSFKEHIIQSASFLDLTQDINVKSFKKIFNPKYINLLKEEVPYLFISWRDIDKRIHIAFTIIQDRLEDCVFNHVILPERFKTKVDPAIAIAEGDINKPLFYVAFVDDHLGSHYLPPSSDTGQLLIIPLDTFFRFAENNEDLWPLDYVPKAIYCEEIHTGQTGQAFGGRTYEYTITKLTDFIENWWLFDTPVTSINLDSNGKEVALLWSSTREYNPFSDISEPILKMCKDYSFTSPNEYLSARPRGVNSFNNLKIEFSRFWEPFYDTQPLLIESGYTGNEQIGSIYVDPDSRPGIFFHPNDSEKLLITWTDAEKRLYIGIIDILGPIKKGRDAGYRDKYNIVKLLNDMFKLGHSPKICSVNDTLGNTNFILGYFSGDNNSQLVTSFLFLKTGIDDYNDLPK
jgi:hypothetical protein